jgi:hypothetical protein
LLDGLLGAVLRLAFGSKSFCHWFLLG